ncbi:hypothetical protein BG011_008051 [Mortierella polycephala]|uniref:G1/S-specific cyclin pas1 n=1 Tax=Mortierella polycephala TaxID=41804 RepID=A0A9P6TXK0_9FUNG|nr:hypothetical protein BG011_008051 [Mortierella polycephala]
MPPLQPSSFDPYSTLSATATAPSALPMFRSWQQQPSESSNKNTLPAPLILDSLTATRVNMVENLVDTAALIIESIWPSHHQDNQCTPHKTPVIPLNIFVSETLRRSRTTLSTLQLALYYIYKVRTQVLAAQERMRQDQIQQWHQNIQYGLPPSPTDSLDGLSDASEFRQRDYFDMIKPGLSKISLPLTPPGNNNIPVSLSPLSQTSTTSTSPALTKSEPVGCGRRMFLAALILASKFQQDRTYSNKAWSKISGLPVSEINANEIAFLSLIDYRLFVPQAVFQKWVVVLTEKGRCRDRENRARQQRGMGSYMTQRWVEAQRRELLQARMSSVSSPQSVKLNPAPDTNAFVGLGLTLNRSNVDPMWSKAPGTASLMPMIKTKHCQVMTTESRYDTLPSPVSSVSPTGCQPMIGSKRRAAEVDDRLDADRESKSQRRLSVSFLVGH